MKLLKEVLFLGVFGTLVGCLDSVEQALVPEVDLGQDVEIDVVLEHPPEAILYGFANRCVAIGVKENPQSELNWLVAEGTGFTFSADDEAQGARFFMKASDLGTYLFYDETGGYLVSEDGTLSRQTELRSDVYEVDDTYISGAEWELEFSARVSATYHLKHRRTGQFLQSLGLVESAREAGVIVLEDVEGCIEHPEMTLDATGEVLPRTYDDGALFGFVDAHSHILTNFGFGGGGIFHGAPFHRLGVQHALGSCEHFHAEEGRADFLGTGFGDGEAIDEASFLSMLSTGRLSEPNHKTDGWPTFSDWPSVSSPTHQTQYYKWLERAWMSGMRLVVQHAVSNEVFCDLMASPGYQPVRYACQDMLNVDRQLEEVRVMERYIDAQSGGPGKGWFRVVESPEKAREVIGQGKLAVVLGIEVPNLFDCYLTPRPDSPECDDAYIEAKLDEYHAKGVRVLFPNHKYDNAFTPGDGHRGIVELGSFVTTAHWSNFVQDCPQIETTFDRGPVQFGGLNKPRDAYFSEPENDLLIFTMNPLRDILPYLGILREPPLEGDWCQKTGLTDKGVTLIKGIMKRGMIPEIDHLPRRSYLDVFALLEESNYPAAGTHGNTHSGKLYSDIGGFSKSQFDRCARSEMPGNMARDFRRHRDLIRDAGGFEATGFGFDFNGLAGMPGPRFGEDSRCPEEQTNPVEYPFMSYDGAITFEQPRIGERVIDFNTEGMVHIGLVAELIEDARRTGVTNEDLDILFRSAEGYIRMWERAESLSKTITQ